jgi:hypothetical protein
MAFRSQQGYNVRGKEKKIMKITKEKGRKKVKQK